MKSHICLLLLAVVLSFAVQPGFCQPTSKTLEISGLTKPVTIRRDGRSVPYIDAANDADLYFAQGFVTASDRLWQMELMRRASRGRLSELFGTRAIEEDKRWRRMGFSSIAEESIKTLDPELKRALENYARGVNAYISTLTKESMPPEFKILQITPEEWRPTDTICLGKILADGLSSTWRQDVVRASLQKLSPEKLADLTNNITPFDVVLFGKDKAAAKTAIATSPSLIEINDEVLAFADRDAEIRRITLSRIGLYAEDLAASNNWVISGKRTADGRAMLANDPHLPPTAPGIWYLSHLSAPGVRAAGVTFPGVPGVVLGHNENIAWGATNVGPDVQDLYRETLNDKGEYKTPTGWEKVVVRTEVLKVRTNLLSPVTETQTFEVQETRNGPIITDDLGQKYALKWTARDPKNQEFEAFFKLNRAKDWKGFQDALKTYGGAAQNFVYADVKGNIGWQIGGRIPLRRTGDGGLPYDGSTNEGDWTGIIPFEQLPMLYNPPQGFIVTANQRTVGSDYRYFGSMARDAANPWRALRIFNLLKDNTKVTMDDVRDIQHDVYSNVYHDLAKEIVKTNAASPETLALFNDWDGKMTADSKAGVIVNEIRNCVAGKIAAENKVPQVAVRERLLYWIIGQRTVRWLPAGSANYQELLKTCDTESRAALANPKRLGADEANWRWGSVFVANFDHPLAAAPLVGGQFLARFTNVNGSGLTPNVGAYVSMRLIATPGVWDATRHVIPLGQSGDPKSPHWKDQFESWRTGTPAILPFSQAAIESATKETVMLSVKK